MTLTINAYLEFWHFHLLDRTRGNSFRLSFFPPLHEENNCLVLSLFASLMPMDNIKTETVLLIYGCITNRPQNIVTESNNMYCLTVWVGRRSQCGLAEYFGSWSLARLQSRSWLWLLVHPKAQLGKDLLSSSLTWFLAGFSSLWIFGLTA